MTTKPKPNPKDVRNGCFLIILLACVISGCFALCNTESNPEPPKQIVSQSKYDRSVNQVNDYLRSNLKDWDSYQSIEWSELKDNGGKGKYRFMIRHKYRAKNSFGGYEIENKVFYLDSLGNVNDVDDFVF